MKKKDLQKLKNHIEENGGVTISPTGELVNFKKGYMVSLEGYEKVYRELKTMDLKAIKSYLKKALKLGGFVGFWLNRQDNKIYLDISLHINDKKQALSIAIINKQLAIYDCKNQIESYL